MSGGHDGGGGLRWLLTYADMITLLMAVFIMMYSMSVVSMEKFNQAAAGLRAEFGGKASSQAGGASARPHPDLMDTDLPALEDDLQSVRQQLEEYIKENELEEVIRTSHEGRGLVITLVSDNLLFPVGEATLRAPALSILDKIARLLQDIPNLVVIEGHTCILPIRTERYPSNWELSAARACAVVRYLAEQWHIDPVRMAATGYGESRPVQPNDSEEGRALNRRVEIVILASAPVTDPGTGSPLASEERAPEEGEARAGGVDR
jgi:chemotaxis protein MotB